MVEPLIVTPEDYFRDDFSRHPILKQNRYLNELKRAVCFAAGRKIMAVDVEAWEQNTEYITEIGLALRGLGKTHVPQIKVIHIQIKENSDLKNGKHVPDNSNSSMTGTTLVMSLNAAIDFIQYILCQGYTWVGHGASKDINWLSDAGLQYYNDPSFDTQNLMSFTNGPKGNSLIKCLRMLDIPCAHLHNAANDAYYTMLLFLNLADPKVRDLRDLDNPDKYGHHKLGRLTWAGPEYDAHTHSFGVEKAKTWLRKELNDNYSL